MKLVERIEAMAELGSYLSANGSEWQETKQKAFEANGWFTHEFIDLATKNMVHEFLNPGKLKEWAAHYYLDDNVSPVMVGLVMAGNIPMVGFHDLLSIFLSGHRQTIKASSKDSILIKHLVEVLININPIISSFIEFSEMLKGCDAYIATGSNNTSRYFKQYFGKYPNIIRHHRTSVAVLDGTESDLQLAGLADDVHQFFGLGCRNVTQLYVPEKYDFIPLLGAFKKYNYLADHPKYKNNYDYYLALQIMNNRYYMTNDSIVLTEDQQPFSAISLLHYTWYKDGVQLLKKLQADVDIQCVVGPEIPLERVRGRDCLCMRME